MDKAIGVSCARNTGTRQGIIAFHGPGQWLYALENLWSNHDVIHLSEGVPVEIVMIMPDPKDIISEPGLIAIIKPSPGAAETWELDLANGSVLMTSPSRIREQLHHKLTILSDAKAELQRLRIEPDPQIRIICLSTIKKLIAKSITDDLNLPNFTNAEDALIWVRGALHEAFDRISRLDMEALVALECQVIPVTIAMEERGMPFKKSKWLAVLSRLAEEVERIKAKLNSLLPRDSGFLLFGPEPIDLNNANSVKQSLEKLLGQKLLGTSQSSLKDFDHEAVKLFLLYREHARMLSTYGEAFLANVDNDRLKGHFIPIGSASGRFACHEPNLLALPNHPDFQACIEPDAANIIMHFDYGAFELRILAALSGDETLIKIFADDLDIHSMVAQEIFNTEVSKTKNVHLRDQAKLLNFGIIYGMGEITLAKQLKISRSAAKNLLQSYFKRFSRVHEFLTALETKAKTEKFVATALGRRIYFSLDSEDDFGQISRIARNMPIQGTGADIVKLAMCRVYRRLYHAKLDAHLINAVHDELVIECAREDSEEATRLIIEEMKLAFLCICPAVPAAISMH